MVWQGVFGGGFPSIFYLAGKRDDSVQQHYVLIDDKKSWHLHLKRNLIDWEIREAITLMEVLESLKINIAKEDK